MAYFHALKGPTAPVAVEGDAAVPSLRLDALYPNPFADRTRLFFDLAVPGAVHVEVFDLLGRRVRILQDGFLAAGRHALAWDGTGDDGRPASPGLYLGSCAE